MVSFGVPYFVDSFTLHFSTDSCFFKSENIFLCDRIDDKELTNSSPDIVLTDGSFLCYSFFHKLFLYRHVLSMLVHVDKVSIYIASILV